MDGDLTTGNRARASRRFLRMGGQYEYRQLTIPFSTSGSDARKMLADEAEYGRWELTRSRLYAGGERRVWLRRKIIRVRSTFGDEWATDTED
jgi:hypothetical protein